MENIIEVKNIGKKYTIGHEQLPYHSLRDDIAGMFKKPLRWLRGHRETREPFWALKDINFEVKRGEVLGIIGANGAGKSTLLKILSRITYPTTGEIKMQGRVGSLLEVGTGFHPELTGRENIYLNGVILGMTKKEIDKKFDEIIRFAGVERFLDTPVKHYSSGMYVRLAFSVAAHLEPDILIVDEVLAVGDADFQKKSLGKMEEITKKEGRTILFVSHNMGAVQSLCTRSLLLDHGKIVAFGNTKDVIFSYINNRNKLKMVLLSERRDREGDGKIRFVSMEIKGFGEEGVVETGKPFFVKLFFEHKGGKDELRNVAFSFTINDFSGHLLAFWTETSGSNFLIKEGMKGVECLIEVCPLTYGEYTINVFATVNGIVADYIVNADRLVVDDSEFFGKGIRDHESHPKYVISHKWEPLL